MNPDAPQRYVRELALQRGITVYVPSPRLRAGFTRFDPKKIPKHKLSEAASLSKGSKWGEKVPLDELPQLFNVIKGDMNLVGPRAEDPKYVASYTPRQRQVLSVKPGITSPASVLYRHEEKLLCGPDREETYLKNLLPAKLAIELNYLERRTLGTDFVILGKTFLALFRGSNDLAPFVPGESPESGSGPNI